MANKSRRTVLQGLAAAPVALAPAMAASAAQDAALIALANETRHYAIEDETSLTRLCELQDERDSATWPYKPKAPGSDDPDPSSEAMRTLLATASADDDEGKAAYARLLLKRDDATFEMMKENLLARIAAMEAYEAKRDAVHKELRVDEAKAHHEAVYERLFDELIPALAETEAHTLAGVNAKAGALLAFDPYTFTDERTHDLLVSLFKDCQRVGGANV